MAHIHAEKMMRYAQDALESETPWDRWEFKYKNEDCWFNCMFGPRWVEEHEYRRKPKKININGFDVPEPLYKRPETATDIYLVNDMLLGMPIKHKSEIVSNQQIKSGLWHLTKEAAQIHLDALLSFTKKDEKEA